MRIYRVEIERQARWAAEKEGELFGLRAADRSDGSFGNWSVDWNDAIGRVGAAKLLPPVQPGKIVAIGLNYMDHIREANMEVPKAPLIFTKFPSSLVGSADDIVVDARVTERVDWEVELGVVVGRRMRHAGPTEALSGVFGYTVCNDISARDLQFADGQWVRGKSPDTFCPAGPAIVTPDELGDPQELDLYCKVNGETVQQSNTREMIFGVADILSYCSAHFTLESGDLVLTGTPWGCGEFMSPKRSLAPGDEVESGIEGIGTLCNRVVAGGPGVYPDDPPAQRLQTVPRHQRA